VVGGGVVGGGVGCVLGCLVEGGGLNARMCLVAGVSEQQATLQPFLRTQLYQWQVGHADHTRKEAATCWYLVTILYGIAVGPWLAVMSWHLA